jgi:hypothetical protein
MSAWDDVQTESVQEIEAAIFRQMEGRSNSDPCSPWADLALALCQRLAAETKLREEAEREVERLEGDRDRWVAKFAEADRLTLGIVRERDDAQARATRAEGALRGLNAAVENLIDAQGFDHEDGCPEDDTCDCPVAIQLNAAGSTAREVITDANDRARALAGEAQKEGTNG